MKNIIFTATLLLANAAMACPGSHLYTIDFKGQPAFQIDMGTAKISRVESNQTVAVVRLVVGKSNICTEQMYGKSKCSEMLPHFTIFGTSKSNPLYNTKANVEITMTDDGKTFKVARISSFPGLARSAGCGPTVEAQ